MIKFYEKMLHIFSHSSSLFLSYYGENKYYHEAYSLMKKMHFLLNGMENKVIIIYADKSFENYCGIFSVILSGNIWLPISPSQPEARVMDIVRSVNPGAVLTDRSLPDQLANYAAHEGILVIDIASAYHAPEKDFILDWFDPEKWAYIMFTSGSTGVPKGVPMTHSNYIPFIYNALEILPFSQGEVFSDYHEFSFDLSIFYLFCAVLTESSFSPALSKKDRLSLIDHAIANKVTVWSSVPSSVARIKLLRPDEKYQTNIKIMFLCGEPFRLDILNYCFNNLSLKFVYNFYGLTETGVENFYFPCSPDDLVRFSKQGSVPIGSPLPGNEIMVTDDKELLISGVQITPGYIGGRDKERFEIIDGKLWFHSGDIVEKHDEIYFCKGRMDNQVKISGYRIELLDIEAAIRQVAGVIEAVCFVNDNDPDNIFITGVVQSAGFDEKQLTADLKKRLPNYMIPAKIFPIDAFGTNQSGKIDRAGIKKFFS